MKGFEVKSSLKYMETKNVFFFIVRPICNCAGPGSKIFHYLCTSKLCPTFVNIKILPLLKKIVCFQCEVKFVYENFVLSVC